MSGSTALPGKRTTHAGLRVLGKVFVALAAAAVVGAVLGSVARLMVRLTTLAAGEQGDFSVAGTAAILLIFAVFTVPGALLASRTARRGRSALLVLGALTLCVPATAVARADLGLLRRLSVAEWISVAGATIGVYAAILAIPLLTLRLLAVAPDFTRR
ncbi:MAG: hypothetical protein ACXWXO_07185 [Nocardioides sp.]